MKLSSSEIALKRFILDWRRNLLRAQDYAGEYSSSHAHCIVCNDMPDSPQVHGFSRFRLDNRHSSNRHWSGSCNCWKRTWVQSKFRVEISLQTFPHLRVSLSLFFHRWQFLPVIGRVIADRLEGKLAPDVQRKFALDRPMSGYDPTRDGRPVGALNVDELCGPGDV